MSDCCCRRRLSRFWEAVRTIGLLSRNGEKAQSSTHPGPVVSLSLIRRILGSSHRPQADLRSVPGANLIILPLLHPLLSAATCRCGRGRPVDPEMGHKRAEFTFNISRRRRWQRWRHWRRRRGDRGQGTGTVRSEKHTSECPDESEVAAAPPRFFQPLLLFLA